MNTNRAIHKRVRRHLCSAIVVLCVATIACGSGIPKIPPAPTEMPTLITLPTTTLAPTATITPTPCTTTLRECAEKKQIQIGTYLNGQQFSDARWKEIAAREFNLAVMTSGFLWEYVEAKQGQFNFAFADEQVAFAQSKNMAICGHPLLLAAPPYIPDWLANGNFSRDELEQILRLYITQVMSRYKGRIGMYIVIEDPYLPPYQTVDVFYQKFGYDYIDLAFQIARETDPAALLIFNNGDNETSNGETTLLTRQIVQRLKSKGLINGVGLEMHLKATKPYTKQDVIATMQSYGLPVYVTEIDVDMKDVPGTQEERYARQAEIYRDMFSACLESGVCKSFAVWGFGDKYSWLERTSPDADPTPFDDDLNPKPAYFAIRDVLSGK